MSGTIELSALAVNASVSATTHLLTVNTLTTTGTTSPGLNATIGSVLTAGITSLGTTSTIAGTNTILANVAGTLVQVLTSALSGGIVTGSGGVTATSGGGTTTLSLSTIAAGYVLANTGTVTAAPSGSSVTALLDSVFGTTQGAVLYRGASTWASLGPGTAGQVLTTGGTGAAPDWATTSASLKVTDGTHTVTTVNDIVLSTGLSLTASGTGTATLLASGGGSALDITNGTTSTAASTLVVSTGLTLAVSGTGTATITASGGSSNPNAYDPFTGLSTSTTYSVPAISSWSWINQGSATGTQATGGPITVACVASSTEEINFFGFAPVAGNWTYTFMMSCTVPAFSSMGVGLGITDGTKFVCLGPEYLGGGLNALAMVLQTYTTTTSGPTTIGGSLFYITQSPLWFLRLQYDGTNIIASFAFTAQGPFMNSYTVAASFLSSFTSIGIWLRPVEGAFSYSDYCVGASLYHVTQTDP